MECTFVAGDKVALCWDIVGWHHLVTGSALTAGPFPAKGRVYTVREVIAFEGFGVKLIGLYLIEVDYPKAFDHRAFRKVDDDELRLLRRVKAPLPRSKEDTRPRETENA